MVDGGILLGDMKFGLTMTHVSHILAVYLLSFEIIDWVHGELNQ